MKQCKIWYEMYNGLVIQVSVVFFSQYANEMI